MHAVYSNKLASLAVLLCTVLLASCAKGTAQVKRLHGVAYSPVSPDNFCRSLEEVEYDAYILRKLTNRVRTYSLTPCTAQIDRLLSVGAATGLKVGGWGGLAMAEAG